MSRWVTVANQVPVAHQMSDVPARVISFDTTEGTFMSVDVSPSGRTLVFDLLGDIYSLPITGGEATPITKGTAWDQAPRYSADGQSVYFVSDRKGFKNIWRLTLSDQSVQQVTQSNSDIMGSPNWSQMGNWLIAGLGDTDPYLGNTEVVLHAVNPTNGAMMPLEHTVGSWFDVSKFEPLRERIVTQSGVQTADGRVYFSELRYAEETGLTVNLHNIDPDTKIRSTITPPDALYSEFKPQLSRDGSVLVYFRQYRDRRTEVRMLNQNTGQNRVLVELENADDASYSTDDDSRPNYAFTPNDRSVVFWHNGKIHRVDLVDGSREIIPFKVKVEREVVTRIEPAPQQLGDNGEASIIRWPSLSRDGRTMAFAAIGYVWMMDMSTGDIRRLTRSSDFEYMPALSPDGSSVAYISFGQSDDKYGPARLVVASVDGGPPQELLADPSATYLVPKWSHDGKNIALIREKEADGKSEAAFGWTPAAHGDFHQVAPAPTSKEYLSRTIYARFVGFDGTGRNLLFSFPRSRNEIVLATAGLDGGDLRTVTVGDADVGGITPAPNLENLALMRVDGSVWLVPFEQGVEERGVSTLSPGGRRVSGGGLYIDWNHSNEFTFGFAQNVYRHKLSQSALESIRVKLTFEKTKAAQSIAFIGARLITMSTGNGVERVIESGTMVVDGQRIVAVGSMGEVAIPSGSLVIDATGKTIMPGLLDTHYHRIGRGDGVLGISAFKLPNPNFSDRSAIEYGVTTAWEPGGPFNDGAPATVDLQVAGRIAGPRWSHSAMGTVGYPWEQLTSYDTARAAVQQHRELGVATLKEYNTPTREQRQWLAAAADANGLGIVSHLETFDGTMTRIVDGYTGGDHPYIPVPFFKDVSELLRQTGYVWTPNIIITPGTVNGDRSEEYFCHAVLEWQDRAGAVGDKVNSICPADHSSPTVPYDVIRFSRVAKQAAAVASNGAHIGVSAHNMPGSNLHQEMWYLWKGGMPIEDVLRATTIGNAMKLGLQDEIGSLDHGKIADFIVLDQNPLDDIINTLSLIYTVQGGVLYDSATAERVDLSNFALPAEAVTLR